VIDLCLTEKATSISGRENSMAHQSGNTSSTVPDSRRVQHDESVVAELAQRLVTDRKLLIASNRGPLYFTEDRSSELTAKRDNSRASESFDLLSGVPVTWISVAVSTADRKAMESLSPDGGSVRSDVIPVRWDVRFVAPPRRVHHKFYNVICNPLLWFLLHRSWSPTFTPTIGVQEHDAWNRGYRGVNRMFADEVSVAANDDSFVLISRDYQLMLVPGMVRESHPNAAIHHSFETPWPWPSDLEIIPAEWRAQVLESLLAADIISFTSNRDVSAFIACATEFMGGRVETLDGNLISFADRNVQLNVSPPSTRSDQFKSVKDFDATKRIIDDLKSERFDHTFVTVDRTEPHKNIVRSINGFGELVRREPELASHVRYLLFLNPGPAHISAYKRLSDEIRRAARRVNEKAGDFQPVRVVEESNFYRAVAALCVYDTLVSVPVIDGSGRTAFDGPMVNTENGGLILSEANVAVDHLVDFVSRVGFGDTSALADAMGAAIVESADDRIRKADGIRSILDAFPEAAFIRQVLSDLLTVT
jgi:trehalose 6-phosphate synthase